MIKHIRITGSRIGDLDLSLEKFNLISGENGVGKSTLFDIVCFAFTGATRLDERLPVELLAPSGDKLQIKITTDKMTIERALTAKKTSTLKICGPDGIMINFTQDQLAQSTAPKDVFLSAIVAGYFMRIPAQRRLDVLAQLVPKASRADRLESTVGEKIPDAIRPLVENSKRSVATKELFAEMRRNADKAIYTLTGELSSALATVVIPDVKKEPKEPIAEVTEGISLWGSYRRDFARWKAGLDDHSKRFPEGWEVPHAEKIAKLRNRAAEIKVTIASLEKPDLEFGEEEKNNVTENEINLLRETLVNTSQIGFVFLDVESMERCHTCGQVVGSKHKEQMRNKNQETKEKLDNEHKERIAHNEKVQSKITFLKQQLQEKISAERKKRGDVMSLTSEYANAQSSINQLESLKGKAVFLAEPTAPNLPSEESLAAIQQEWQDFFASREAHKYALRIQEDKRKIAEIKKVEIEKLQILNKVNKAFEDACDHLDTDLFKEQEDALDLGPYKLLMNEGLPTVVSKSSGVPFEWMSSGQQICASMALCQKIQKAVKGNHADFVLVDNSDLISGHLPAVSCQYIGAKVTQGPLTLSTPAMLTGIKIM
jgi:hypothetical protein